MNVRAGRSDKLCPSRPTNADFDVWDPDCPCRVSDVPLLFQLHTCTYPSYNLIRCLILFNCCAAGTRATKYNILKCPRQTCLTTFALHKHVLPLRPVILDVAKIFHLCERQEMGGAVELVVKFLLRRRWGEHKVRNSNHIC